MKEVKLPSGATLEITPSSFAVSKALYKAVLVEAKGLDVNSSTEMVSLYKQLFCAGFASDEIEKAIWECFKKCTYDSGKGKLKIDADTFESVEAREDYWQVCLEVAKENIAPFVKNLYVQYGQIFEAMLKSRT